MLLEDKNAVLVERGADVSEVRHVESGRWVPGPDPQHRDYSSFAFFNDPEDNSRVPQEARRSELIGTVANVRAGPRLAAVGTNMARKQTTSEEQFSA